VDIPQDAYRLSDTSENLCERSVPQLEGLFSLLDIRMCENVRREVEYILFVLYFGILSMFFAFQIIDLVKPNHSQNKESTSVCRR
jgi:hypothetical protein